MIRYDLKHLGRPSSEAQHLQVTKLITLVQASKVLFTLRQIRIPASVLLCSQKQMRLDWWDTGLEIMRNKWVCDEIPKLEIM